MQAVCQPRRALVEIPAPQPKIAAGMRRSYLEILSPPLAPSPLPRGRNSAANTKQSLGLSAGPVWRGGIEEQREKMDQRQSSISNRQLAQLIRSLVSVEQNQESRILTSDLKYLQEDLQLKKANVYRSIPYSRFCSNRDAHCYRKAYPHLVAFQVSCEEWGQVLLGYKAWDAVLEHTLMAWRFTSELPRWDAASHNALRERCYGALAARGLAALQRHRPEPGRGRELLRRMKMAQWHSQSIVPCILELQRILGRDDGPSADSNNTKKESIINS